MSAPARWNPWLMKWSSSGQTRTMPTSVILIDGRTTTVSTKHLAPRGELDSSLPQTSLRPDCSPRVGLNDPPVPVPLLTESNAQPVPEPVSTEPEQTPAPQNMPGQGVPLRRSSRISRPPDCLLFKPHLSPPPPTTFAPLTCDVQAVSVAPRTTGSLLQRKG